MTDKVGGGQDRVLGGVVDKQLRRDKVEVEEYGEEKGYADGC